MIRAIILFLGLWGAIAIGIVQVRHMTNQQMWSATKIFGFSLVCALLALLVMVGLVILF